MSSSVAAATIETTTTVTTEGAPAPEKRGFELGLRAGVGLGLGSVLHSARTNQNTLLLDNGTVVVPFTLEAGYRLNRQIYLGAFGSWSWISPRVDSKSFCTESMDSCSASLVVLGGNVRFHPAPDSKFDPWLSLGAGYEWVMNRAEAGSLVSKSTFRGLQWLNVGVGGDLLVSPRVTLGPYLSGSVGQFTNYSIDLTGAGPASTSRTGSVDDLGEKRVHMWASLGIRGAIMP